MAIQAWRKRQRIELYQTIATVTAAVHPEKAQSALNKLLEEMFPEVKHDRARAVDKAIEIMEEEKQRTYSVAPVGHSVKRTPMGRLKNILRERRQGRRKR